MTLQIEIDPGTCLAHGDCAEVAPEAFAIEDIAVATGGGSDEQLIAAAQACPAGAIALFDAASGEQVYP